MNDRVSWTRRAIGLAGLGVLLLPSAARAHAIIVASEPAEGAVVPPGPVEVTLRYNSRLDRARSQVLLIGADGAERPLELGEGAPAVLVAHTPPLAPGAWRLRWQVLALDGHITRGDIRFTVAAR